MLKLPVKVHIPIGSVTEFILRNTNLDLKELIPKAVADYLSRNTGERFNFLADNHCFIPDEIEKKAEFTLSDIITDVTAGKNFRTTIADLMKVRGQQKRTDFFIKDLYSRLGNAGVYITTLDGTALSKGDFKDMDKTTEIIVCLTGHNNITDSDNCR